MSWHVKPGDTVTINQIIVDIETAKAVVELPSPYAGTVSALLVDAGQTVDVGTPIIAVEVPGADDAPAEQQNPRSRSRKQRRTGRGKPRPPVSRCSSATASSRVRPAAGRGRSRRPGPAPTRPRRRCRPPASPFHPASSFPPASPRRRRRRPPGRDGRAPWRSRPCGAWPGTSASTSASWRAAGRKAWSPGMTWSAPPTREPRLRARSRKRDGGGAGNPGARRRGADPGARGAQAHRRGDGRERVHRAARDRVPPGGRHRDDGRHAPGARAARVRGGQGVAAAVRGEGTAHRGGQAPHDQLHVGRGRAGDRGQAAGQPRHRRRGRARAASCRT